MDYCRSHRLRTVPAGALGVMVASALTACATTDEGQPQVAMAPAATKAESVSVFGVFRNGRMSPEAWEDFGKALSTPFSEGVCKAAFDVVFADAHPELAAAVDDYAKENGVSDELLEKFAPLAKGDTILLIAIDGQPPKPAPAPAEKSAKPPQDPSSLAPGTYGGAGASQPTGSGGGRGMGRGGGRMGGRKPQSAPVQHAKPDKGSWELTAYFYSVRLRQVTSQVDLTQQGQDIDGDLKLFAAKLGTELPGVPCRGWSPEVKVDVNSIRKLTDQ